MTQVNQDIQELTRLAELSTRPRIKEYLLNEVHRLQSQLIVQDAASGDASVDKVVEPVPSTAFTGLKLSVQKATPQKYYKDITTYGLLINSFFH